LDAALSAGGYYDVAHGRESARAQRIQVIDLSRHPGLSAAQVSALPPDRQYKYQIERAELELTVGKAMQKKFDLITAERTVVCESIAASNDDSNPPRGRALVVVVGHAESPRNSANGDARTAATVC
jgi:hypothetical protein